jgi:hypothetical protein
VREWTSDVEIGAMLDVHVVTAWDQGVSLWVGRAGQQEEPVVPTLADADSQLIDTDPEIVDDAHVDGPAAPLVEGVDARWR